MFPTFEFDLFRDPIDVSEDFISWYIFHEVYENDEKLQGHSRKALKPKCPSFTLTKKTPHALVTTLRDFANLIKDLLNENYYYILTARFQSDPIEYYFSKERRRQMSGRPFLVSMR